MKKLKLKKIRSLIDKLEEASSELDDQFYDMENEDTFADLISLKISDGRMEEAYQTFVKEFPTSLEADTALIWLFFERVESGNIELKAEAVAGPDYDQPQLQAVEGDEFKFQKGDTVTVFGGSEGCIMLACKDKPSINLSFGAKTRGKK